MKRAGALVATAVALACATARASAWDDTGHRQIADIAWNRLNHRAKGEIRAILMAGDPRFRPVSDAEPDVRDAFRKLATFPDVIKFTKTTLYEDQIDSMNRLFFVASAPDPNDSEDVRCKTWHYYDVAIRDRGKHGPKESNALKALRKARTEIVRLERSGDPDRKSECWWLAWIEHLVGDLHQPLHCCSSFALLPNGDAGGNLFPIKDPVTGRAGRLHAYWDGAIGRAIGAERQQGLSPNVEVVSERWARSCPLTRSEARNLSVISWIKHGAALADTVAYKGIEPDSAPSQEYAAKQAALCERQAVLAGFRLAALLNEELGREYRSGKSMTLATETGAQPNRQFAALPSLKHRVAVIAHRAGGGISPENTLAAIRRAIALGVDYVELDIRATKDGSLVIMHDRTVDRTTNGSGAIKDLTLAEVRALDAGSKFDAKFAGERVPTFDEALRLCKGKVHIYVDHKVAPTEQVFRAIRRFGMEKEVVIYNGTDGLQEWKRIASHLPVMPSVPDAFRRAGGIADYEKLLPAEVLDGNLTEWTRDLVEQSHGLGVKVYVDNLGANDNAEGFRRAIDMGVDGIQTDFPDQLLATLRESPGR